MALYEALHFVKHQLTARSLKGHGVHSPFVYELVSQILPDASTDKFDPIEQLRRSLENDLQTINVTDLGAGSQIHRSSARKVSEIAQHSANSARIGRLLNRLVAYLNPPGILELGTSLGITTAYLAYDGKEVTSIEGCPEIARIARQNLDKLDLSNVQILVGSFDENLDAALSHLRDCRMVFIDGHHEYNATLRYYNYLLPRITSPAVIIFDDIYWSAGMKKAWKKIVNDERNQVTIDLFHLGLVFLKPDQAKEHFRIKL